MKNEFKFYDDGSLASASGPKAIEAMRCFTLASALKLYSLTKILPNRHLTATGMLALANKVTGHTYKRGSYMAASLAAKEHATRLRDEVLKDQLVD